MVHTFSDKKTSGSGVKNENMPDQRPLDLNKWQLAKELHKPIFIWFEKKKKKTCLLKIISGVMIWQICNR